MAPRSVFGRLVRRPLRAARRVIGVDQITVGSQRVRLIIPGVPRACHTQRATGVCSRCGKVNTCSSSRRQTPCSSSISPACGPVDHQPGLASQAEYGVSVTLTRSPENRPKWPVVHCNHTDLAVPSVLQVVANVCPICGSLQTFRGPQMGWIALWARLPGSACCLI